MSENRTDLIAKLKSIKNRDKDAPKTIEEQLASDMRKKAIKALAIQVAANAAVIGGVYAAIKIVNKNSVENETTED